MRLNVSHPALRPARRPSMASLLMFVGITAAIAGSAGTSWATSGDAMATAAADGIVPAIEKTLIGVPVGATIAELEEAVPGLFRHELAFGDVRYEGCDPESLVVYTFVEQPTLAPGVVSDIWIKQEDDVSSRFYEETPLPTVEIDPRTPRGIALGDDFGEVLEAYGPPTEDTPYPQGLRVIRYRGSSDTGDAEALTLTFTLAADKVVGILLAGTPAAN